MKLRTLICGFTCGVATMLLTTQVASMTTTNDSDEDLRQAFKEAAGRNEFSRKLRPFRGQYRQQIKWWRSDGSAPVEWDTRSNTDWVLDSRFAVHNINGRWLDMSFEAMLIVGYDGTAQQYTAVWMDTLGSRTLFSKGTLDESGETITLHGEYADPITREPVAVKINCSVPSRKGDMKLEMFRSDSAGKEFKFIEVDSQKFVPTAG